MGLSSMEKAVRDALEPYPRLKAAVNRIYQVVGYALSRERLVSEGDVRRVTPDDGFEYFFGYYDKSPWDAEDRRMIALRVRDTHASPAPAEPGELVLIDTGDGNSVRTIARTRTWNVQQGCMAQWLGPNFDRYIIYNDLRDDAYCSVIYDANEGREVRTLPMPVYDVARDGNFALSLDFSRLHRLRPGYGYANLPEATAGEKCPDAPCIWRMDLADGRVTPILKYTDFAAFEPVPEMAGAEHKVNHLMLSPDGSRFMVLHRWFEKGRKYTRLVTANADGSELYNLSDDGFVSHCYWKNDREIISFLRKAALGEHYYLMRDRTHEFRLLWAELGRDGHCSYSPDRRFVVTDNYPNRARIATVYLCSDETNRAARLARVFSPLRYHGDCRCDLHPRWNRRGDMICIDSVHEGRRGLYVIPADAAVLDASNAKPAGGRPSLKARIKGNRLLFAAASAASRAPYPFYSAWMRLCHAVRGVEGDKVLFSSYDGTLFNDNPRAVAEALHAVAPAARILFRLSDRGRRMADLPDWVTPVPKLSLRTLREMATARVIVTNAGMQRWMVKFDDQLYIQTWHGDRGFKKIRLDLEPQNPYFVKEARRIDLAISGSDFGSRVFESAMAVPPERILACGCPRNDLLLKDPPEVAGRVRAALGIPRDARVLMYAPTFRVSGTGGVQQAGLSLDRAIRTLERSTGEKWLCITRSHETARGIASDAGMDVSSWPETNELLLITDMLITDYSSIGGDFVLLGRPVIFYQPDRGDYDRDRGLYFDPDRSPLIVAHDEGELLDILSKPIDAEASCRAYLDFFGSRETGHASEAVAARIAAAMDARA